jgi:hypothetical protein
MTTEHLSILHVLTWSAYYENVMALTEMEDVFPYKKVLVRYGLYYTEYPPDD